MRRLTLLTLLSCVALWGCPGEGPPGIDAGDDAGPLLDGGSDAAVDAGPDAGGKESDAGDPDAGDADGGEVLPPQVIEEVLPPRGGTAGGTRVVLRGSGFLYGVGTRSTEATRLTSVRFGNNPAQDFLVVDDRVVDVKAPPGVVGPVDVSLESPRGITTCVGCFSYFEELALTGATPREGPPEGGTPVVLTGQGFTASATVLFGDRRSPEVTVISPGELHALSPRGSGGEAVDLVVYDQGGLGLLRRAFRYEAALRVTGVQPAHALLGAAGVEVELEGSGLDPLVIVEFGGLPATVLGPSATGGLRVAPPPGITPGAVDVTVHRGASSWTLRQGFSWVQGGGGAALHAASPRLVPLEGGTIRLVGGGLAGALAVRIDGVPAGHVVVDDHVLEVTVPARPPGGAKHVGVEVVTPGGTLDLPVPLTYRTRLDVIAPAQGPAAGGSAASVGGAALPPDAVVRIGALEAPGVQVLSEAALTLVTPPGATGPPEDLWAFSAGDPEDEAVLPAAFRYDAAIAIGRVTPDTGAIAGNTLVTVLGEGFGEGTVVHFGARRAKDIKVLDAHTLTCRIPKGEVGTVDVVLSDAGRSDTLASGFSYVDPTRFSGGLSGGPLIGTLNVTVLERGGNGVPIPLAHVMLGADPETPFQGFTDGRGQLTFSDPALVKAQVVTVSKEGFSSTTVSQVSASNLTVFVNRTGGGGAPGDSGETVQVLPSLITGRVTGFKAPRPLAQGEHLEARVFVADSSLYATPPFRGPSSHQGEVWKVTEDGGDYRVFSVAGRRAVYAVFGIATSTGFTPSLMGLRRNIPAAPDRPQLEQDIVLDMHLDTQAPILLEGPVLEADGSPATTQLYAWLELGAEGFVPNPFNWSTGTGFQSAVSTRGDPVVFPGFPALDGRNFVLAALSRPASLTGASFFFRRQPGPLEEGIRVGPLLQVPTFTAPTAADGLVGNRLAWTSAPGPTPDLHHVTLYAPTPLGSLTLWTVVLPGSETQVLLPAPLVARLRAEWGDLELMLSLSSSRSPSFRYEQWSYDSLGSSGWTSYTTAQSEAFRP